METPLAVFASVRSEDAVWPSLESLSKSPDFAVAGQVMHASDLTVGQVSAIIAAGVAIAKLCLPNLLAFLVVGTLREHGENVTTNAVSWSAIGRLLHSSGWPTLLGSDSAANQGVIWPARIIRFAGFFGTLLISVAAVVTPLGLYEDVVPGDGLTDVSFHYIADTSIFGKGTPKRNESLPWSRLCIENVNSTNCPSLTPDSSTNNPANTRVPPRTIELFSSGVSALGNSVSSVFDIQWRSWTWRRVDGNGSTTDTSAYPIGIFSQIASVVLDDKLKAVEGLIVDAVDGGIGFRNHSAPPPTSYGSTWTEDLMFIQPVTQCVDTNLTIEYTIPLTSLYNDTSHSTDLTDVRLVDRGGFSHLNTTFPRWNRSEAQTNPDFWTRAYQAAWLNNVYAMKQLHVADISQTNNSDSPPRLMGLNSTLGQEFRLPRLECLLSSSPQFINTDNSFGCFAPRNFSLSFNITPEARSDYISEDITSLCEGSVFNDMGNLNNPSVACGLIFGSSHPLGGSSNDILPLPGTRWTKPMYTCASGAQALIKTVTFAFNTTDDINGLTILGIANKTYPSEVTKPLWGVENLPVDMDILAPLWGLLSPEALAAAGIPPANIETLRREHLFLPGEGVFGDVPVQTELQNLPGVDFFRRAMSAAYSVGYLSSSSGGIFDYSGETNLAMSMRWTELSLSPESMARLLNLIWTDYATNSVLGTKGLASTKRRSSKSVVSKRDGSQGEAGDRDSTVPVTVYSRQIRYDLRYAVPAILVLVSLALTSVFASVAILFGQTGLAKMRRYLNATSTGRILVATLDSPAGRVGNDEPGSIWASGRGRIMFSAGRDKPAPADQARGPTVENKGTDVARSY